MWRVLRRCMLFRAATLPWRGTSSLHGHGWVCRRFSKCGGRRVLALLFLWVSLPRITLFFQIIFTSWLVRPLLDILFIHRLIITRKWQKNMSLARVFTNPGRRCLVGEDATRLLALSQPLKQLAPHRSTATTVASNKWAPWRLWESTWRISGMKSLSISGCTIGFRHHLRHLPVHFVIAPLVLTSLAINLVYQLVWWAAYFFQVTWEISQVAVMIIFVWRQIHSGGQIHNKLIGCKGGEAPWIMRSWRFATGLGRDFVDAEVWGHFAGSTTTHVRDLKFEWNCQKYFEHKRSAIRKTSMFSCQRHWQNAEKLRINDNYHVLLVQALSPGHLKLGSLGSDISSNLHLASWYWIHFIQWLWLLLFFFGFVLCHAFGWTQHLTGNLRLIFPSLNKATNLFTCHQLTGRNDLTCWAIQWSVLSFLERPEGLKIKKQIVFGNVCCLFTSFQKSENHISQTTTPKHLETS